MNKLRKLNSKYMFLILVFIICFIGLFVYLKGDMYKCKILRKMNFIVFLSEVCGTTNPIFFPANSSLSARYFIRYTATIVLPLPGIPFTTTRFTFPLSICASISSTAFRWLSFNSLYGEYLNRSEFSISSSECLTSFSCCSLRQSSSNFLSYFLSHNTAYLLFRNSYS